MNGRPVKANQEMVVRLTWMNAEWRAKVYLETRAIEPHALTPHLLRYPEVALPSGKLSHGRLDKSTVPVHPKEFIGKDAFDAGFFPVLVKWGGADAWTNGIDALWWSPASLGLPSYAVDTPQGPEHWVRVEDLCWVLDKPRCQPPPKILSAASR